MGWIFAILLFALLWVVIGTLQGIEGRLHDIHLNLKYQCSISEKLLEAANLNSETIAKDLAKLRGIAEEYERSLPARYSKLDIQFLEGVRMWRASQEDSDA